MKKIARTINAVVFDLDDTLYPEIQYVRSGYRAVARELSDPGRRRSVESVLEMLFEAFRTGPRDRVFNQVLKQLGQPDGDGAVKRLMRIYREHVPALQLDPVVSRTLAELRGSYPLGLLSDGFLPAQRLKLDALRLEGMFEHVLFTETLGRQYWKPHPRGFQIMMEQLGVEGDKCVYVADNPAKDFLAPNQLGWCTVQVEVPSRIHVGQAPTREHRAQFNCHFQDLANLLIDH